MGTDLGGLPGLVVLCLSLQASPMSRSKRGKRDCDKMDDRIVTKPSDLIVTELSHGPSSARQLSQRLDGISYANIRQTLGRLAKAGIVTRVERGVYACCPVSVVTEPDCDNEPDHRCDSLDCDSPAVNVPVGDQNSEHIRQAVAAAFEDYAAMDDPFDARAWA